MKRYSNKILLSSPKLKAKAR